MNKTNILLFGGTFDPIHLGYLSIARAAAESLAAAQIILIPAANPPHKNGPGLTPAPDRLAMAHLAVESDPLFEVSDCELLRPGPSFTLDTVRHFRRRFGPNPALYWLIGADTLPELPGWYQIDRLVDECTIVTARRPGFDPAQIDWTAFKSILAKPQIERLRRHLLDTPEIPLAATELRRRLRQNQPVDDALPAPVLAYIRQHHLYQP